LQGHDTWRREFTRLTAFAEELPAGR
jgi:hypothetical protein